MGSRMRGKRTLVVAHKAAGDTPRSLPRRRILICSDASGFTCRAVESLPRGAPALRGTRALRRHSTTWKIDQKQTCLLPAARGAGSEDSQHGLQRIEGSAPKTAACGASEIEASKYRVSILLNFGVSSSYLSSPRLLAGSFPFLGTTCVPSFGCEQAEGSSLKIFFLFSLF